MSITQYYGISSLPLHKFEINSKINHGYLNRKLKKFDIYNVFYEDYITKIVYIFIA